MTYIKTTVLALFFLITLNTHITAHSASLISQPQLVVDISLMSFTQFTEKPYLALWYTDVADEKTPLLVLRGEIKWLRDLKSFWRNIARYQRDKLDGITAATVKAGDYRYQFPLPQHASEHSVEYQLEVVRENGARELLTLKIDPTSQQSSPLSNKTCLEGKKEIRLFCIRYED